MKFHKTKTFKVIIAILAIWALANVILYEPDIPLDQLKAKYTNTSSKFIEIDGMQVHYRIEGEGEPLILIHGTGSMLQTWDEWRSEEHTSELQSRGLISYAVFCS